MMSSSKLMTPKHESPARVKTIDTGENTRAVACLVDDKHVVSGGAEGKIRLWRMQDGKEAGAPVDVGSVVVCSIAVSRDGKWVVGGTNIGRVVVWDGKSSEKAKEFTVHDEWVRAVDVSLDGTRIATGSYDRTASIWSFTSTPEVSLHRLFGPLRHEWSLAAVKFSPDGHLIATATWCHSSIRIYDGQRAHLLVEFSVQVNSSENYSLAWASDSRRLFALSREGNIVCLDVYNGTTLSQWPIHSSIDSRCIVLACDGRVIAASAGSSVSFWDTTTHKLIGTIAEHPALIASMAITKYDVVISGGKKIMLRSLCDVLPSSYCEERLGAAQKLKMMVEGLANRVAYKTTAQVKISNLEKTLQALCREDGHPSM